jgi:ATP-dependent RNA helicase DeaD
MSLPDLPPALAAALTARGYADLTPVQAAVLEPEARGRDLLVSARTGSGKTVAYGLALGETILSDAILGQSAPRAGDPLALIVAPTRELAQQVERELAWLYASAGVKVVSCVGGMDIRREQRALAQGAHIVVGTPGRLCDHLKRGWLKVENLASVVLDEADEMLDLGFREELEEILDQTPADKRTLMFSATVPKPILAIAKRYQRDALRVVATAAAESHSDIDYRAVRIAPSDIEHAVVNLLRFYESGAALVFCSTREAVRRLHANLVERGFSVVALSGELSQNERSHALQALRDRRARVCIATDVAARGIDIPDLDLVIHADLPGSAETLQHRSGRTGRAGKKGVCVVLVPHNRRRKAELLFKGANIEPVWETPPAAEDIRARDQERLITDLKNAEAATEDDQALAAILTAEMSGEQIAVALARLARARLPAPEDMDDAAPEYVPREMAAPRQGFEDTVWFRITIGHNRNAEPRWILPLICRRGHLTKQDIGAIRVFQRETRFQIKASVADRFLEAAGAPDQDGVIIERADGPAPDMANEKREPRGERPLRRPRSEGDAAPQAASSDYVKPAYEKKPYERPAYDKPAYAKKDFGPRPDREEGAGKPKYPKREFDRPRGPPPAARHDPLAVDRAPPRKDFAKPRYDAERPAREGADGPKEFKPGWAQKKPFKPGGPSKFAGPAKPGGGGAYKGKSNDGAPWAKTPYKGKPKPARD